MSGPPCHARTNARRQDGDALADYRPSPAKRPIGVPFREQRLCRTFCDPTSQFMSMSAVYCELPLGYTITWGTLSQTSVRT